jgi:DNA repair photolyase
LGASHIVFGVMSDPFLPFQGKFDASMRFLELFQRYRPGLLSIQTRSPLLVIALPVLKRLGEHCSVTLGLETSDDESALRYTPSLPRVEERLKTARALRRFGVEVTLQVSPLLPYGRMEEDAPAFAELLCDHADYLLIEPIFSGPSKTWTKKRTPQYMRKMAAEQRFEWFRPDAANALLKEVSRRAPEKLQAPCREKLFEKQLGIFAA